MDDALAGLMLPIDNKPGEVLTVDILRGALEQLRRPPSWDGHYCEGWMICANQEMRGMERICVAPGMPCVEVAARA